MNRSDLVEYSFRGSLKGYEEPNDRDEESSVSGQDLVEVSEETRELLTTVCTRSVPKPYEFALAKSLLQPYRDYSLAFKDLLTVNCVNSASSAPQALH